MSDLASGVVAALQRALAAEQQAVFGYEALGPRVGARLQDLARECQSAHESARDGTAEMIASAHARPRPADAEYRTVQTLLANPRSLAARLEDDCAAAWRFVYAVACGATADTSAGQPSDSGRAIGVRRAAQRSLTASAVRATRWRRHAMERLGSAFPGG